ncbi:MAG: peptidoglycan-binding domain-containing protein [Phycisphaerae bacterium]|jgi:murein L,D-transpeptidase YcbB/YkuD
MSAWKKLLIYFFIIGLPFICIVFAIAIYRGDEIRLWDKIIVTPNLKDYVPRSEYEKIKEEHLANLSKMQLFKLQTNTFETDTKYSFSVLSSAMSRMGKINTKSPADNEAIRDLYKHIQKCLSAIGIYNDHCDGEQPSTYTAVIEFQTKNKLEADGIVGEKTWKAIKATFDKEKVD